MTDTEARERGYRTGLDTLVVHAVNDDHWGLAIDGESLSATVKLKGIDGGPHKRRNMWFNSMIREEPYPGLNVGGRGRKRPFQRWPPTRCCMVVVSSCREVSA